MTRFIPKEKMSRKQKREEDRKQRRTWEFCPASRIVESKKHYNRKRQSREASDAWGSGIF